MPDFNAAAYVEAMERLGYIVRAIGDRWYWRPLKEYRDSPELRQLQASVNASDENTKQVLSFLVATGRVDRRQ